MTLIEIATHVQSQLDQATARIGTLAKEHSDAIAAKDAELATIQKQADEFAAYKTAMESRVSAVLQSGDPAEYEKLAVEFLTPAQELERQKTVAKIAALKAEAAALELLV